MLNKQYCPRFKKAQALADLHLHLSGSGSGAGRHRSGRARGHSRGRDDDCGDCRRAGHGGGGCAGPGRCDGAKL